MSDTQRHEIDAVVLAVTEALVARMEEASKKLLDEMGIQINNAEHKELVLGPITPDKVDALVKRAQASIERITARMEQQRNGK